MWHNNEKLCCRGKTDVGFRGRSWWRRESTESWEKYKIIHKWLMDTGWDWWFSKMEVKKSKICSKMRLKLYQVPCLQQITVINLTETFLKLFLGFVKHQLSLFENVGWFTVCEHTPVMPGTGTLDSIYTVCTIPSMTRPTSDAPSDAPSVLLVPGGGWAYGSLTLMFSRLLICCQCHIYGSRHRFASAAKAALIWSSCGFLSTNSLTRDRGSGLEISSGHS